MALSILRCGIRASLNIFERTAAASYTATSNFDLQAARPLSNASVCSHASCNLFPEKRHRLSLRHYNKRFGHKTEKKYETDYSSASDDELKGHRGESELWRRKMRTFHGILDVNKDGVVSYDDFKLLADRFVDLGHLSEENTNEFRQVIRDLWEKLWGEVSPYNLVTVEKYLEDMHHVLNDKELRKKAHRFLPFLFKAVDKDKSGEITVEEFKLFFNCLGLKEQDAIFSFRVIDTNGDGKISIKEFINHGRRFFLSEDEECISKYFCGPLVSD